MRRLRIERSASEALHQCIFLHAITRRIAASTLDQAASGPMAHAMPSRQRGSARKRDKPTKSRDN